jgi:hypothetical protein
MHGQAMVLQRPRGGSRLRGDDENEGVSVVKAA